jgi:hypothetical protein
MRLLTVVLCLLVFAPTPAVELADYLPAGVEYDSAVPKPSDVFSFEVGEWHVRHDLLVSYLETLADASPRVTSFRTGRTHEGRPLLLLAFSSAENIRNLDALREAHLAEGERGELGDAPLVVWSGHSVHGNEPSGVNMAPLLAYHLAAGGGAVEELLSDTIVLMDPAINPDGIGRFATWANTHKSRYPVADPVTREHNEVWPRGRTNHYWFDLNRDWLLLTHPESRARVEQYHRWRPHVLTDHHEMGSNSTYFFQPGVPERRHPWTPERNHELTAAIGKYHAEALDAAGQMYYAEEGFDDFYYGKGSTYPDVNGTVGILFEQASSRGHLMDTQHGLLDFPTTIRNQFLTALSTIEAADAMRDELRDWQAGFWNDALDLAEKDPASAYVFGDAGDPVRALALIDILRRHQIEVRKLASEVKVDGRNYSPGSAWVVPLRQRQYRLIKSIFEYRTEFTDDTFYDVSAFNLPLAFNLPFAEMGKLYRAGVTGEAIDELPSAANSFSPVAAAKAYAFSWSGYGTPRALQRLLSGDFSAYVTTKPMTVVTPAGEVDLDPGAILVPLGEQGRRRPAARGTAAARKKPNNRRADLEELLGMIAKEDGVKVHAVTTGLTPRGVDLGSPSVDRVQPVKPLLVVGSGVSGYDSGEVWHLLDTRVDLPLTMVDTDRFKGVDLRNYTHVILVDGNYKRFAKEWTPKLKSWTRAGGVLVAMKRGADWVTKQGLHSARDEEDDERGDESREDGAKKKGKGAKQEEKKEGDDADEEGEEGENEGEEDEPEFRPYGEFRNDRAKRVVGGAIFETIVDPTHPIGYGFLMERVPVHRNSALVLKIDDNPYTTPLRYTDAPLLSGYASKERQEEIAGSAAIVATKVGSGVVIRMIDNPNFRGIWYGTNKLFLNALFFGPVIDATEIKDRGQ